MLSWYALQTKPRSENLVCRNLMARGIEAYLPLWQVSSRCGGGRRPFFPGYLFAHADLEVVGLWALLYLPGVRRLVFSGDQPARLQQRVIEEIQARLSRLDEMVTDANGEPLMPGDRVLITSGLFAGFEAIFERRLSSDERVRLLIDFIRKGTALELDRHILQKRSAFHGARCMPAPR